MGSGNNQFPSYQYQRNVAPIMGDSAVRSPKHPAAVPPDYSRNGNAASGPNHGLSPSLRSNDSRPANFELSRRTDGLLRSESTSSCLINIY